MRLRKGAYYHSSMLMMGLFCMIGPLFGLPFVTGSLPHSPQFVRAMARLDDGGRVLAVNESRIAPLLCYALIGATLFAPAVINAIPAAAVQARHCGLRSRPDIAARDRGLR